MQELIQKFTTWVNLKIRLHIEETEPVYFREREIWWCSLGVNIGHEQNGKNEKFERPVLILRKFNKYILWEQQAASAKGAHIPQKPLSRGQ